MENIDGLTIDGLPPLEEMHDDAVFYVVLNNEDYHVTAKQFKELVLANLPDAELPPGLVNEELLNSKLGDYFTVEQVANAIREAVEQIPQVTLPENLATTEQIQAVADELSALKQTNLVTVAQLSEAFQNFVPTLPADLVTTQQLGALEHRVSTLEQNPGVTEERLAEAIQAAATNPDDGITRREVVEMIAAIEHPENGPIPGIVMQADLDPLKSRLVALEEKETITPDEVDQKVATAIEAIPAVTIPEDVLRADDLEDLAGRLAVVEAAETVSPAQLEQAIQAIPEYELPEDVARSASVQAVDEKVGTVTQRVEALEQREVVSPVQLEQAIQAIPEYELPESVANVEQVSLVEQKVDGVDQRVTVLEQREVVSPTELTQAIATVQNLIPTDVAPGTATAEAFVQTEQRLQTLEQADFITTEQVRGMIQDIPEVQMPSNMATTEQVASVQQDVAAVSQRLTEQENRPLVTQEQLGQAMGVLENKIPTVPTDYVSTAEMDALVDRTIGFESRLLSQEQRPSVSETEVQNIARGLINGIPPYRLPETVVHQESLDVVGQQVESLGTSLTQLSEDVGNKLSAPAAAVAGALLAYTDEGLVNVAVQAGRVYHVNGASTNAREDGSVFAPFKTIQRALDTVPASSLIQLAPGSYRENLNPKTRSNLLIQGHGCIDSILTEVVGTVTIGGAGYEAVTRFRMKDVTLKNASVDTPALVFDSNAGRHYFHNVTIEPIANTTVAPVQFIGAVQNWTDMYNCNVGGTILLDGTPAAGASFTMRHAGHAKTKLDIKKDYTVLIHGCTRFGFINHEAGVLSVTHAIGFAGEAGVAINSTADTGGFAMQFSSMVAMNGVDLLKINKTGACAGVLGMNVRSAEDVLEGAVNLT